MNYFFVILTLFLRFLKTTSSTSIYSWYYFDNGCTLNSHSFSWSDTNTILIDTLNVKYQNSAGLCQISTTTTYKSSYIYQIQPKQCTQNCESTTFCCVGPVFWNICVRQCDTCNYYTTCTPEVDHYATNYYLDYLPTVMTYLTNNFITMSFWAKQDSTNVLSIVILYQNDNCAMPYNVYEGKYCIMDSLTQTIILNSDWTFYQINLNINLPGNTLFLIGFNGNCYLKKVVIFDLAQNSINDVILAQFPGQIFHSLQLTSDNLRWARTVSFEFANSPINIDFSENSNGLAQNDTFNDITQVNGSNYNDYIASIGNINYIKGLQGNDTLVCPTSCTFEGNEGIDIYVILPSSISTIIIDFEEGEKIDVSSFLGVHSMADFDGIQNMQNSKICNIIIRNNTTITINKKINRSLNENDFIFSPYPCYDKCPLCLTQNDCNLCQNCDSQSCDTNGCSKCNQPFHLLENYCIDKCPTMYYQDDINLKCVSCNSSSCLQCNSNLDCLLCLNSTVLYNNQCYSQCPQGSYLLSNNNLTSCVSCSKNCKDCSNNGCDDCYDNYLLMIGNSPECILNCDDTKDFFLDENLTKCVYIDPIQPKKMDNHFLEYSIAYDKNQITCNDNIFFNGNSMITIIKYLILFQTGSLISDIEINQNFFQKINNVRSLLFNGFEIMTSGNLFYERSIYVRNKADGYDVDNIKEAFRSINGRLDLFVVMTLEKNGIEYEVLLLDWILSYDINYGLRSFQSDGYEILEVFDPVGQNCVNPIIELYFTYGVSDDFIIKSFYFLRRNNTGIFNIQNILQNDTCKKFLQNQYYDPILDFDYRYFQHILDSFHIYEGFFSLNDDEKCAWIDIVFQLDFQSKYRLMKNNNDLNELIANLSFINSFEIQNDLLTLQGSPLIMTNQTNQSITLIENIINDRFCENGLLLEEVNSQLTQNLLLSNILVKINSSSSLIKSAFNYSIYISSIVYNELLNIISQNKQQINEDLSITDGLVLLTDQTLNYYQQGICDNDNFLNIDTLFGGSILEGLVFKTTNNTYWKNFLINNSTFQYNDNDGTFLYVGNVNNSTIMQTSLNTFKNLWNCNYKINMTNITNDLIMQYVLKTPIHGFNITNC